MNRDKRIDLIKGLLIFIVVFGHFVYEFHKYSSEGVKVFDSIYNVILSFHMPAFIFLSGYLSKHIHSQRKNELDLLYPFICFQVINMVYTYFTGYGRGNSDIFTPIYQNWYLLALFFWRTFLPYSAKMKTGIAILAALLLSFTIGFISPNIGKALALHRTFYFFPFFLFGYYVTDIGAFVRKFQYRRVTPLASILFTISLSIIFILSWKGDFSDIIHIGFAPTVGYPGDIRISFVRAFCMIISTLIVLLFVIMMYNLKLPAFLESVLVRFGNNTMPIYLVHTLFIYPIVPLFLLKVPFWLALCVTMIGSWVICLLLSNNKVVNVVNYLCDGHFLSKKINYSIFKNMD